MGRTGWRRLRIAGAVALLAVVGARVGAGPFAAGLLAVRPESLLAAVAVTGLTTVAAAWRWQVLARWLGDAVPLPVAVGAYYRSQFLNSVLPGGIAGDLHRGVSRGRDRGDLGGALRAVGWDRVLGQAVQVAATAAVLLLAGGAPAEAVVVLLAGAALVLAAIGALALLGAPRAGLATAAPRVLLASLATTAGHAAVLLVAARAVGVSLPTPVLLPLVLLVLLAMALPLSVAGWGIREGAAAWLFGAAGAGPDVGVAVATAYGTMALVAVLPGGALLLLDRLRRRREEAG